MAKTKDAYAEMLEMLSPEDREMLAKLTGQENSGGGTKTPVIKINYRERAAQDGTKVAKGNFCIGQKNGMVEGKQVLLSAGTDLGSSFEGIILKKGTQYSYWNSDPKKRCSSQIICERGEEPTGYNLKFNCSNKSCPRRKDGIDKAERCTNQFVVYVRLPEGTKLPDGTSATTALLYVKGTSYKVFQSYMDEELKGIPSLALKTKFGTTEDEQGSTLFYIQTFTKGAPVPREVIEENVNLATGISKQLIQHKEEQAKKLLEAPKETSGGSGTVTIVNPDENIEW